MECLEAACEHMEYSITQSIASDVPGKVMLQVDMDSNITICVSRVVRVVRDSLLSDFLVLSCGECFAHKSFYINPSLSGSIDNGGRLCKTCLMP